VPASGDWSPDRRELHAWLEEIAPSVAPVYAGAVAIIDDTRIPARDLFIWHAIREIRRVLPLALNGGGRTKWWSSTSQIKTIARHWRGEGLPMSNDHGASAAAEPTSAAEPPDSVVISAVLAGEIARLIEESEAVGTKQSESSQIALSSVQGSAVPPYVAEAWTKAFENAPGYAHIPDKPHDLDVIANATDQFKVFESTLMTITRRSHENMDELDDILARANGS
jgi:hypothetical protein